MVLDCTAYLNVNATKTFAESTEMVLVEDDGDHCGPEPTDQSNNDDHCQVAGGASTYNKGTSQTFTTNDAGFSNRNYEFNSCGGGDFHATLTNSSVLDGSMDEAELRPGARPGRHRHDGLSRDPAAPAAGRGSSTAFEDVSGCMRRPPALSSGCPVSGTTGRINRRPSSMPTPTRSRAAPSAWATAWPMGWPVPSPWRPGSSRPPSPAYKTSFQPRATTATTAGASAFPEATWRLSLTATGPPPQANWLCGRWSHVAAVVDASYGATFYVNGAPVAGAHQHLRLLWKILMTICRSAASPPTVSTPTSSTARSTTCGSSTDLCRLPGS